MALRGRYHRQTPVRSRVDRAVEDATIKTCHHDDLDSLRAYVVALVTAYNFAEHLKALRWRTPYAIIGDAWTKGPSIFKIAPHQLIPGPHSWPDRRPRICEVAGASSDLPSAKRFTRSSEGRTRKLRTRAVADRGPTEAPCRHGGLRRRALSISRPEIRHLHSAPMCGSQHRYPPDISRHDMFATSAWSDFAPERGRRMGLAQGLSKRNRRKPGDCLLESWERDRFERRR
jgi:hypothetical protein